MAYTHSQATAGRGSTLSINTGTLTTPVWTPIGEWKNATQSGNQWKTIDVTNMDSGPNQEIITSIRDNGTYKVSGNRVSTDPGQVALNAAYNSGALTMFELLLPLGPTQTTTGDMYAFTALVESYE
ncbi:MAG: phage tail tube protein, partial [Terracidiphilus sp.]